MHRKRMSHDELDRYKKRLKAKSKMGSLNSPGKFKVGDHVINKRTGETDVVKFVPGMPEYDARSFFSAERGMLMQNDITWQYQDDWDLSPYPPLMSVNASTSFTGTTLNATYQSLFQNYGITSTLLPGLPKNTQFKAEDRVEQKKVVADMSKLDALVIDPEVKKEIVAVLKQNEKKDKMFTEWGLGEKIEYGRGMAFLFWGKPGTGKTFGARCIAKALGQELMVISSSDIQTQEPGGAERNIKQAFATAKEENKILFIDECDSLIFNRANLGFILAAEVNTLLTEIEKSEGITILATNRVSHMDEALERRISLIVEFPEPNKEQRLAIWKGLLPEKMPLADDVKLEELSEHSLSGGIIKNVVLQAARLALADDHKEVSKDHFEKAIERSKKSKGLMGQVQYQKQGELEGGNYGKEMTKSMGSFLDIYKTKREADEHTKF